MQALSLVPILLFTLVLGCTPMSTPLPTDPPDLRGTITQVRITGDRVSFLLTTRLPAPAADRFVVFVTPDTRLYREEDGRVRTVGVEQLSEGESADVWFSGPIRESYPAQVNARAVLLRGSAAP